MLIDRDDTDERIARVKLMLAEARLKKAQMVPTDRERRRSGSLTGAPGGGREAGNGQTRTHSSSR